MDIEQLLVKLQNKQILNEIEVRYVCNKAKEIFFQESNIVAVDAPIVICGDVHGQFYDVLKLFEEVGQVPYTKYIFIGDFVDRGYNSVETFEYFLCLKILYPEHIILLRGNHESRQITQIYGFYDEISKKYGNIHPWTLFVDIFDYLPLGCLIEDKVLCIHGGLSPNIKTLDQIRTIKRVQEIPYEGPFCDLMWSDPDDISAWQLSNRGAGWLFGNQVTEKFNEINNISLICRAHQLAQEGYQYWFPQKNLVTIWSAPNYCYRCGNAAAVLKIHEDLEREMIIFKEADESQFSISPQKQLPYFL